VRIAEWQLRQRQAMPLDIKVKMTPRRIKDWCQRYDDEVYVAFSGGLDSTVLLHLVRRVLPECPSVFHDTGLEFPEIRDFVKTVDNVTWTKPRMTFKQVLEKYGYPVVSKRTSQYVLEARETKSDVLRNLRLNGVKPDGRKYQQGMVPDKWKFLINAPFKISPKCCTVFKKWPAADYEKETGRKAMVGTRADEGEQRLQSYMDHGCNGYDMSRPRSAPVSFWTHDDIWEYIRQQGLEYSRVYDMGHDRTGCMFCMLGCHLNNPNRFQLMEKSHPQLHKYCMEKLGLREVLEYIGVNPYNTQLELFPTTGEE
jgi:3'-phosphoadenosine 5'-phosphosulfate sulfotransferase (PAPS reductase)/FAD synthetase